MVTTTIALDEATHRRLRHLAIEQGTSFRELIRAAIGEYLGRMFLDHSGSPQFVVRYVKRRSPTDE